MVEFFNRTCPKAKKEHICDLCRNKIAVGEKYIRTAEKYDGDMFDLKYHISCQKIIDTYCEETNEGEYSDDEVLYWLQEKYCHNCEKYEECMVTEIECPIIRENFGKEQQ